MAFSKDPSAVLDYKVDWSRWLDEDTIASSTFTVEAGLSMNSSTNDTTAATVWLSGGTVGEKYAVTNRITTIGGRTDERTFRVDVKDR